MQLTLTVSPTVIALLQTLIAAKPPTPNEPHNTYLANAQGAVQELLEESPSNERRSQLRMALENNLESMAEAALSVGTVRLVHELLHQIDDGRRFARVEVPENTGIPVYAPGCAARE